jgi:hypothetical protein
MRTQLNLIAQQQIAQNAVLTAMQQDQNCPPTMG